MKRRFITLCLKGTSQVLSYAQTAKTTHVLQPPPHTRTRATGDEAARTVWYKCCEGYWYTPFEPGKMSFILSGFFLDKELYLNKVVKALREDIFMYKQTIPAPFVAGTRAKSVNFTDGVGLSSSRWQNSAKNLVNLTLALWCGKTTTSLMPCQCTSPALPVQKWNLYSLNNEV